MAVVLSTERAKLIVKPGGWLCDLSSASWPPMSGCEGSSSYSQKEGSLDLNFRGSGKAIEPLQGMFATTILKLPELPPDPKDGRIYDLNPLLLRSFQFVYGPGSGIQSVAVRTLRLSSRIKKGDRITLEADTSPPIGRDL